MPTTQTGSSIVRNTSGGSMYFDFIGPRGATLDADEDVLVPGNVLTEWARNPQKQAALNYALQNNLIEILKTPSAFAFDETDGQPYALGFDNGSPVAIPPDYGSYDGDAPTV